MSAAPDETVREITTVETGTIGILNASEIDQQIATAHKYPRAARGGVRAFLAEARDLATLTEDVAQECIYALKRGNKVIEGPSARLAEIVAHAWGNCRAGARVVDEGREFVTAQGVFHDLERNVAITYEVKRRITDSNGRRYSTDMIGVTANAACSIALRNAVFKGVPKALWAQIYSDVRRVVMGDVKTLANRRADALAYVQRFGVTEDMACATLGVAGIEDIGLEELVVLRGICTAIREGEITPEQAFMPRQAPASAKAKLDEALNQAGADDGGDDAAPRGTSSDDESAREETDEAALRDAVEAQPEQDETEPEAEGATEAGAGQANDAQSEPAPAEPEPATAEAENGPAPTLEELLQRARTAESEDDLAQIEADNHFRRGSKSSNRVADAVAEARRRLEGGGGGR